VASLSANANSVLILSESSDHLTLRLFFYQNTAGDQSSNLVVNGESLLFRTQILHYNNAAARFVASDLITGSLSGAVATVCYGEILGGSNTIVVTEITGNTAGFENNDVVTGNREGSGTATVTAVTSPRRVLSIDSVLWSVNGPNASVGLECSNGSAFDTSFMLSGQGYYGRNELDAPIPPTLSDSNGNLYISTYNIPAKGGYSITLTLRKTQGYASPPGY
jgi:hypothetical protein